jgi:hypothetical protein
MTPLVGERWALPLRVFTNRGTSGSPKGPPTSKDLRVVFRGSAT